MNMKKIIAVIMLLTSSMLTAFVCRDLTYPFILCVLGLFGLRRRLTWNFRPQNRVITSLLLLALTLIFAFHYHFARFPVHVAYFEAAGFAWQTITRYFLASMVLMLFLGPAVRLPYSLGFFHIAITISAGQILLLDDMNVSYRLLELLSVLLVVLYAAADSRQTGLELPSPATGSALAAGHSGRSSRGFAFSLVLLIAINGGWIAGSFLYRHAEILDYMPLALWNRSLRTDEGSGYVAQAGFDESGRLSSVLFIKQNPDSSPVLTITSDTYPGYLRARAFDFYYQSSWHDQSIREAVFPQESSPLGMYLMGRMNTFRVNRDNSEEYISMTIRHEFRFEDDMFTPLGTILVEAPVNVLMRDDDEVVYTPSSRNGMHYGIAYTKYADDNPPSRIQNRRMLNVPANLDARIRQMADRIFTGRNTTAEKIDAVIDYFNSNYTYNLGLEVPRGRDKLTYFLLDSSTGYCEYFASGAAILLRLAGVPNRYVTGFHVSEKAPDGKTWIARNMDAHAWVEAWDAERRQWTIVEATVGEGAVAAQSDDDMEGAGVNMNIFLSQLKLALYQYGIPGLLSVLYFYNVPLSMTILSVLLAGLLVFVFMRYRKRKLLKYTANPRALNPAVLALHKMLDKMDRKVKSTGLQRQLTETLHTFAKRLRGHEDRQGVLVHVSDWYLEYADIRYSQIIDSQRVKLLQQRARGLYESL
jgi:transglutaminase-like putative cysteine protease